MQKILFIFFLFILVIFRGVFNFFFLPFLIFFRFVQGRILFELKNKKNLESRSFRFDRLEADICFEISSEGELEQVRPLIEKCILSKKRVEIIYSSPSVEDKIQKIANENSLFVRVFRLPIITYFWFDFFYLQNVRGFLTAKKIAFCRYDFYPELLLLAIIDRKMQLILLSGAYTKKLTWFKKNVYCFFDIIVASNLSEESLFKKHYNTGLISNLDFRVMRIFQRLGIKDEYLASFFELENYLTYLKSRSKEENLILGSAWPSDLDIFRDEKTRELIRIGKMHLTIVPHSLKNDEVLKIKKSISSFLDLPIIQIDKKMEKEKSHNYDGSIVLVTIPGILCELYSYFGVAIIGGGFDKSVHSLLEPFLAGTKVLSGPKIDRSTEFDLITSIAKDEIDVFLNPNQSYDTLMKLITKNVKRFDREKLRIDCDQKFNLIYDEIFKC